MSFSVIMLIGALIFLQQSTPVESAVHSTMMTSYRMPAYLSTIACATSNPDTTVPVSSKLQCLNTCRHNNKYTSFNYKTSTTGDTSTCELFVGLPTSYSVVANCQHYQVTSFAKCFKWSFQMFGI